MLYTTPIKRVIVNFVLIVGFMLISNISFAQKSKFIGDYQLSSHNTDTITGRLFISLDTFKLIYQVWHDSDLVYPMIIGIWDVDQRTSTITLRSYSGSTYIGPYKEVDYGRPSLQLTLNGKVYYRQVYYQFPE